MLEIAGAVTGGLIICLLYYLTLHLLDKKETYGFPRRNNLINSVPVTATGIFTLLIWIAFAVCKPETSILRQFLNMCMIWGLAVLSVTDWAKHIIPNKMLIVLLVIWVIAAALTILFAIEAGMALVFTALAGALIGGIIFLLCYLLSRRQLGAGDVKLVFVLGLYLTGERIIGTIFYGVIFCCIFSLIQLCRKKIGMKDGVPLVPFLYLGTVITILIL